MDDDPDRVYYWWHLGTTLASTGKTGEAQAALLTGIETARRTRTARARLEATLSIQALTRIYLEAGEPLKAMDALQEGLSIRPGDPAMLLQKARSLVDMGHYTEALPLLSGLLIEDPQGFCDPDVAYDLRIFGEWAYDLIGVAQFRLEHFADAAEAFLAAAAGSRDPRQHRARAAVAAARSRGLATGALTG
ncbi:MAG: tetratricopeptide repeat protein [Hyphomicrobiales bacterium]|nr:tetratricopeptide repeat protein [Hyphomicrobiales bacterium]